MRIAEHSQAVAKQDQEPSSDEKFYLLPMRQVLEIPVAFQLKDKRQV